MLCIIIISVRFRKELVYWNACSNRSGTKPNMGIVLLRWLSLCVPWHSLLGRIPDKNDRCAFTRGSRGEVTTFFEKNKVLGVEPNRVLNILLEGI